MTRADFKTLEKALALDELRNMPRLGVRIFEERATDVRITLLHDRVTPMARYGAGSSREAS